MARRRLAVPARAGGGAAFSFSTADVAKKFLAAIVAHPKVKRLLSTEHFSVDGTLIEVWAFMKSFRPKDGSGEPPASVRNGERDFHGEAPSNATHQSTTDPDSRVNCKGAGREARLCFMGHALMENRNGLMVDGCLAADPYCGDVFIFRSKRKDRLKLLAWDGSGMVLATKWLADGGFTWPSIGVPDAQRLDVARRRRP